MRRISRSAPALHLLLAGILVAGCTRSTTPAPKAEPPPPPSLLGADALVPSPRLIIGRIVALDPARSFAFVELSMDAPIAALAEGSELITRTLGLKETGRLHVSRQVRGRTLGTTIVSGQPGPGDEVVWLAP